LVAELTVTVIPEPALTVGLEPKPFPLSVTLVVAPIGPLAGEMLVMTGVTSAPPLRGTSVKGQYL
jgi:hypothetical protein